MYLWVLFTRVVLLKPYKLIMAFLLQTLIKCSISLSIKCKLTNAYCLPTSPIACPTQSFMGTLLALCKSYNTVSLTLE